MGNLEASFTCSPTMTTPSSACIAQDRCGGFTPEQAHKQRDAPGAMQWNIQCMHLISCSVVVESTNVYNLCCCTNDFSCECHCTWLLPGSNKLPSSLLTFIVLRPYGRAKIYHISSDHRTKLASSVHSGRIDGIVAKHTMSY